MDLPDFSEPLTARNEGSALGLLVKLLTADGSPAAGRCRESLGPALRAFAEAGAACNASADRGVPLEGGASTSGRMLEWARGSGIRHLLTPAVFPQTGARGGAAARDVAPGESVVSIPADRLITARNAAASPLGQILLGLPLDPDTRSVLWAMRDRADPDSEFRAYWDDLPPAFATGATLCDAALRELDGTPIAAEVRALQSNLRQQFDTFFPGLSEALPLLFPPEVYTWDNFVWMCGLWVSRAAPGGHPPPPAPRAPRAPPPARRPPRAAPPTRRPPARP